MPEHGDENLGSAANLPYGDSAEIEPGPIEDDEFVYRHVPGGIRFQNPPDKPITSENFQLRSGENGLSVSRSSLTTPEQLLQRVGNVATGSRIAACRVGDLRVLGFEVIRDPLPEDPGHALLLPGAIDLSSRTPRKRLANLFHYIDLPDRSDEGPPSRHE